MARIADRVDEADRFGRCQRDDGHPGWQGFDTEPRQQSQTQAPTDHVQGRDEAVRFVLEVHSHSCAGTGIEENRPARAVPGVIVDPGVSLQLTEAHLRTRGQGMVVRHRDHVRVLGEEMALHLRRELRCRGLRNHQVQIGVELVPRTFGQIELHCDIGVAVLEVSDEFRQPPCSRRREVPDRQTADSILMQVRDALPQSPRALEHGVDVGHDRRAGVGQAQTAPLPLKERQAGVLFEKFQVMTDRRWGEPEMLRGGTDGPGEGDRFERFQVRDVVHN